MLILPLLQIIYVISAALLPMSIDVPPSIAIAANTTGMFNIMLSLVESNQLGKQLNSVGPFTVFAPTDEAFSQITDLEQIIRDPQMVIAILLNHVVPGYNTAATLTDGQVLKTMAGDDLVVSIVDNVVMINDATVTQVDIIGSNGVVHAIDST